MTGITTYVTPAVAAEFYSVSVSTLRNWSNDGKINTKILKSGHRRYCITREKLSNKNGECYIYARVSSYQQKPDLLRQVSFLRKKYPTYKLITDIGSGLNYKRKGFLRILQCLLSRNIKEVVVTYKDRFCRFGYEHFEWLFKQYDAKIYAISSKAELSAGAKFTEDLMSIMGFFNARYNGARHYDNKKS